MNRRLKDLQWPSLALAVLLVSTLIVTTTSMSASADQEGVPTESEAIVSEATSLSVDDPTQLQVDSLFENLQDVSVVSQVTPEEVSDAVVEPFAAGDLQLSLRWLDAPAGQDQNQTWSSPTQSRDNQIFKYSLGIQTNNTSYDTGQLTVRIKRSLWAGRDGTPINPSMIGIPEAPTAGSPDIPFNYRIDGDEIVITNTAPTGAAGNYSIQVQYNVNPWNTIDQSNVNLDAKGEGKDANGGTDSAATAPINLTVDTEAKSNIFVKSDPQPMYYWDTSLTGGTPMPADFANYRWVSWRLAMTGTSNQPYRTTITDIASPDGQLYAISGDSRYPQNTLNPADFSISGPNTITSKPFTDINELGPANGAERYLRVLVRYPLGNDGDVLTNTAVERLTGVDGKDTPTPLESSSNYTWKNFELKFDGEPTRMVKYSDTLDRNDREIWSKMVLLRNGLPVDLNWGMVAGFDLYPGVNFPAGQTYNGEVTDDFANFKLVDGTANTSPDPWVRMTADDYYYSSATITLDSYLVDRTSGQRRYYQQGSNGPLLKVWAKTANSTDWVEVESFYAGQVAYDTNGALTSAPRTVALPARTTAVKTTFENASDHLTLRMDLAGAIRGNTASPTLQSWFANLANDDRRLRLQNFGYYRVNRSDGTQYTTPPANYTFSDSQGNNATLEAEDRANYGSLVNRRTAQIEILDMIGRSDSIKLASTPVNDVTNRMVDVQFWLNNIEAFQGITDPEFDSLLAAGWQPPSRDEAVFYDLLPLGAFYNASKAKAVYDIKGGANTSTMTVETIDNYRGTGRQLVILRVKANTAGQNYVNTGDVMRPVSQTDGSVVMGPSTWNQRGSSGYSVMFTASIPWDNVPYARNSVNNAAYQVPEDQPLLGNGVPDDGRGNTVMGSDGRPVFYDLRGNGVTNVNDTQYMNLLVPVNVAVSTGSGLSKLVRADSTGGLGAYNSTATVEAGEGYTYQLRAGSGDNTSMRDLVLFDILESAAESIETSWKGTFDSITLSYAVQAGINPVVYYSIRPGLTYTGMSPASLNDTAVWSTTQPADKTTITAIAVDLRKAADGSDFVFPPQAGAQVLVHMTAPTTRQNALTAYNRAAYYSTQVPNVGDPSSSFQVGSRTLVYLPHLAKSSEPAGGNTAATATTSPAGDYITYTLSYNTGNINTVPLTVSDVVPVGLTLVPGSITFTSPGTLTATAVPDSAYNAGTRTITWPTYTQSALGTARFTFRVTIDALPSGTDGGIDYRLYANQGSAVRGEHTELSETLYHKQLNRWATLTKTAALVEGATASSPDAATGGTAAAENPGSATSPVLAALGQVVEYRMVLTNTGRNQLSGALEISDVLPAGTTYVPGSARVVFSGGVPPSQATSTLNNATSPLIWTIQGMSDGETARIYFRVVAPTTAFVGGETSNKASRDFNNTATLTDRGKNVTSQTPTTYHRVGESRITVEKTWVDDNVQDVTRPNSVTVQIFADNVAYGQPVQVTSADSWRRIVAGLPRWSAAGREIVYTVAEIGDVGQYQTSYSADTFSITNHYSPGWTSRTVVKTWEDNANAEGIRPSSIRVQLLADGVPYREAATLNAAGNWQYVFGDLPATRNDVPITYSIREIDAQTGYATKYDETRFIITNTLIRPVFVKSSTPAGGTDPASATTLVAGQEVTYTLTYDAGVIGIKDIVVSDTVPQGMTLVPGSITFFSPGQQAATTLPDASFSPGTRVITWPAYEQTVAGNAVFTFKVTVDALPDGALGVDLRFYQNQAKALRSGRFEDISNSVTHKQLNRWATLTKTAALVDGVTASSPDAATGGSAGDESAGSAESPVITALGQVVEYRLGVTNTGADQLSGILEVSDTIPPGTVYIPGSARVSFTGGVMPSQATGVVDDSGSDLLWTLDKMSHGETARISFRVVAPATAFVDGDTSSKERRVFTNTATLIDRAKNVSFETPATYHVVEESRPEDTLVTLPKTGDDGTRVVQIILPMIAIGLFLLFIIKPEAKQRKSGKRKQGKHSTLPNEPEANRSANRHTDG